MRLFNPIRARLNFLILRYGVVAVLLFLIPPLSSGAQAGQFKEYDVKAVFVYNLTNFITWPPDAFEPQQKHFHIVIVGKDPFGSLLDHLIGDEKVKGKYPIVIERVKDIDEVAGCHMLFVSKTAKKQWPRIFEKVKTHSILTVADTPGFAHSGGMINLVRKGNRIQIEINADRAKHCGLNISAKLLELSKIITP